MVSLFQQVVDQGHLRLVVVSQLTVAVALSTVAHERDAKPWLVDYPVRG